MAFAMNPRAVVRRLGGSEINSQCWIRRPGRQEKREIALEREALSEPIIGSGDRGAPAARPGFRRIGYRERPGLLLNFAKARSKQSESLLLEAVPAFLPAS
jgi:hypothetical protein